MTLKFFFCKNYVGVDKAERENTRNLRSFEKMKCLLSCLFSFRGFAKRISIREISMTFEEEETVHYCC